MSPAARHRARSLAAQTAALATDGQALARPEAGPAASAYELQRARLGVDLRRLREIQSIERKIDAKREMLPAYADWVAGVLAGSAASGKGVQDDVLVQVMIWTIDVGDYAAARPLIEYVLKWDVALPERFNRTAATMIAEEIADAALKALTADEPFAIEVLRHAAEVTDAADMHDQVRAKLEKALGLALARQAAAIDPDADGPAGGRRAIAEAGLRHLRRAHQLNRKAGVAKSIEKLERDARRASGPEVPPA